MDLALLLAIALIVGIFFWLRRYQGSKRWRSRSLSPTGSSQSVRSQTQRQLLRLVGGNRAVAERLVEQVQLRNPNHSQQWCWEKAIYDIQRDRRT
ncbi:hypothetical protein [Nodosilinea sp. P-1105]|uniref:hypothetical protein n=1 Tax=Nodosilinea sp. P-1105 TaxID=2546229 RepID=UPI00146B286C|nr:hypothetical protein [Nodosilinea sp. P-1105]NMF85133.1 hypothetical protein [Nodosilinea sp. P-1105]